MRAYGCLVLLCVLPVFGHSEETPEDAAARLVKALGADSFEERNEAEKKLSEIGLRAKPALDEALKSEDAEVRMRAMQALRTLLDVDARVHEREWIAKIGPGFGAEKLNAAAPDAPKVAAPKMKDVEEPVRGRRFDNCVDSGLAWLAEAQETDGHWDSKKYGAQLDGDLVQTGWALLAFLGAGHTEKVGTYRQNVQRAVEYLRRHQRADGAIVKPDSAVDGITHAVCALALAEAAGMARRADTIANAQLATDYSCNIHQTRDETGKSGFGRARNSSAPDLFITTLFVLHMKSAKVAGLRIAHDSFDGAIKFIDSVEDKEQKSFKLKPEGEFSSKAALMGCLARQFLGWKKEDLAEIVEAGVERYGLPSTGTETSDDFTDYIGTLAIFQQGGDVWKKWNAAMKKSLLEKQARDGTERGSWAPSGVWAGAGRVTATALNTLDLEVYYRYRQLSGKDE